MTGMAGPMEEACCGRAFSGEDPTQCPNGYPETCDAACAGELRRFRKACAELLDSEVVSTQIAGVKAMLDRAIKTCPPAPGGGGH